MRAACLLVLALVGAPTQDRDAALQRALDAWVDMWNRYDLDEVGRLFVTDERVTYFSSEVEGLITGFEAVRAHHEGFGFASGGARTGNRLWLEDVAGRWEGTTALVAATWLFQLAGEAGPPQRGPVTFVLVPVDGAYRILHAHFANAPAG